MQGRKVTSFSAEIFIPVGFLANYGPKGTGGRAESHPASMTRDNFAVRNSPLRGLDAPTPAREEGLQPYGALYCFRWRSEGVQGASGKPPACIMGNNFAARNSPLAGPDAPTPAREKGLQPYGALYCFGWRSEGGAGGGERKATLLASWVTTLPREFPIDGA